MHIHHVTPILNVSDVGASIAWFEQFGWERGFTWNERPADRGRRRQPTQRGPADFGSVRTGHAEIFLCLRRPGRSGRRLAQLVAADAGGRGRAARHRARARHDGDPTRRRTSRWGMREFHLRHPEGHTFRVSAPLHEE